MMGVRSYEGVVGLGSGSGLGEGLGSDRGGEWVYEVGLGKGPRWCCSPFNGFVLTGRRRTKALKRVAAIIR